jgi:DNA-binding transcriptional LysR family regulator
MNWDDVRIFLAVARAGQFLGAARRLELNHATVSRRIAALEEALRAKLFRRLTTGSELTPAGTRFLDIAERMEADMIAARSTLAGEGDDISGTVRIGAPDGFGTGFLAPRLAELSARHPDLTLELVPVPRAFSLSRREADIAVTVERPREGRLVARKLVDYRLGLYASPAYLKAHGMPRSRDELARHRLVGYVEDLIFSPSLAFNAEFSRDWRSSIAVSSALGQIAAVRAGAGIGVLHAFMAHADPGLVPVLPKTTLTRAYWTVVHEDLRTIRRIQAVAAFLAELVARERALFA